MGCAPIVVSTPLYRCDECMKEDTTPKDIVAWIVVAIVGVILFSRTGVGLIVYECDLARALLAELGLQGWALAVIPLLCCLGAGWLVWRYLHGSRRFIALLVFAACIGDITLRVVAPNLEERVREFGRPVCQADNAGVHDINCSP